MQEFVRDNVGPPLPVRQDLQKEESRSDVPGKSPETEDVAMNEEEQDSSSEEDGDGRMGRGVNDDVDDSSSSEDD